MSGDQTITTFCLLTCTGVWLMQLSLAESRLVSLWLREESRNKRGRTCYADCLIITLWSLCFGSVGEQTYTRTRQITLLYYLSDQIPWIISHMLARETDRVNSSVLPGNVIAKLQNHFRLSIIHCIFTQTMPSVYQQEVINIPWRHDLIGMFVPILSHSMLNGQQKTGTRESPRF